MPKRAARPTPVPCAPLGILADPEWNGVACPSGHEYVCGCGEKLHYEYDATGIDGSYLDSNGESIISKAPDLWKRDPKAFVEELQRTDMAAYSAWSAAYSLGMWPARHVHYPVSCHDLPHKPSDVPECCDWPMHLARDGWRCRETKTLFPFVSEDQVA